MFNSHDPDPLDEPGDPISPRLVIPATQLAKQFGTPMFIVGRQSCAECESYVAFCQCPTNDSTGTFWEMLIVEPYQLMSSDLIFMIIAP